MQRVTLLTIGRLRDPSLAEVAKMYIQRLKGSVDLRVVELPAGSGADAVKQKSEEAQRLLRQLEKVQDTIYILDETGAEYTSAEFSSVMSSAKDKGDAITFVLGGAFGLTDDVRKRGKTFSLSKMTFPHELCRVVFLEQLYRATEIMKGSGYHH